MKKIDTPLASFVCLILPIPRIFKSGKRDRGVKL